jgi:trypsin
MGHCSAGSGRHALRPWLSLLALAAACGSAGPLAREAGPAASPAIINGVLDTTHEAVVAIVSQSESEPISCSGTIIKVDAATHVGFVLTAAHCVGPEQGSLPVLVVQASDFQDPKALRYRAIDYTQDPRYTGDVVSGHDLALIRVAGVDAATPTLPLASFPDGLASGTPVLMIGYGQTTLGGRDEVLRYRRSTAQRILMLLGVGGQFLYYDQSITGTCYGDSGGPDLSDGKIVGVHSYGEPTCGYEGASGRVSVGLDYIDAELARPAPPLDCTLCDKIANSGLQPCVARMRACLADPQCGGLYACLQACNGTWACKQDCLAAWPKAEGPLTAAQACSCDRDCRMCQGELQCLDVPNCGFAFPAGACAACTESACCQQAIDCGADGTCYACLKRGDADPECAASALRQALKACVEASCASQCAAPPADGGAGGGIVLPAPGGCAAAQGETGALLVLALAALARAARGRARR